MYPSTVKNSGFGPSWVNCGKTKYSIPSIDGIISVINIIVIFSLLNYFLFFLYFSNKNWIPSAKYITGTNSKYEKNSPKFNKSN